MDRRDAGAKLGLRENEGDGHGDADVARIGGVVGSEAGKGPPGVAITLRDRDKAACIYSRSFKEINKSEENL